MRESLIEVNPENSFLNEVTRFVAGHAISLATYVPENPKSFGLRGSGTLVKLDGIYGILTAWHVTNHPESGVDLSPRSEQILKIIVEGGMIEIECKHIVETVIASCDIDCQGPDMSFLRIPESSQLSLLKAKKSFWDLRRGKTVEEKWDYGLDTLMCTIGSPGERYDVQVCENEYCLPVSLEGFIGRYISDHITTQDGFEYYETEVEYREGNELPSSFEGVSGGGLWMISFFEDALGKLYFSDRHFCGVAFHQSSNQKDKRIIRHHFRSSIYSQAFDAIEKAA